MVNNNIHSKNITRNRYDRIAFLYDFMEAPIEWLRFSNWRSILFQNVAGKLVLEVGVGTGKNMPYYPIGVDLTAIDISPRMLEHAQKRADVLGMEIELLEMDAQRLAFPDNSFDTVFATFVFCSVPDPVIGLRELRRVCKPDGRLLLLEHMRPNNFFLGFLFDFLNPFVVRMMGANINRRTMDNVRNAGWQVIREEKLSSWEIFRFIEAEPSNS